MRSLTRSPNWVIAAVLASAAALAMASVLGFYGGRSAQAATVVMVGAGDIASCSSSGDEATARLLDGIPGTVFTLGDNVYPDGTAAEFKNCYGPSWGRHKARTMPSVGNHEYHTAGASGYFDYFGAEAGDPAKGYYSYDLGDWHIVVLNSNCSELPGGCKAGSPQEQWLRNDLAAHPNTCTAAYFHSPRFSSGSDHGNVPAVGPFWEALYDRGADVVLSGHDHDYERFAPQDPSGQADSSHGIREFVVGTGGPVKNEGFGTIKANSEVRISGTNGVLKLTLHPQGYDWRFVTAPNGAIADSGSGSCHSAEPTEPDAVAPPVSGVATGEGATGAGVKANVEDQFSERVDPSSVTSSTF